MIRGRNNNNCSPSALETFGGAVRRRARSLNRTMFPTPLNALSKRSVSTRGFKRKLVLALFVLPLGYCVVMNLYGTRTLGRKLFFEHPQNRTNAMDDEKKHDHPHPWLHRLGEVPVSRNPGKKLDNVHIFTMVALEWDLTRLKFFLARYQEAKIYVVLHSERNDHSPSVYEAAHAIAQAGGAEQIREEVFHFTDEEKFIRMTQYYNEVKRNGTIKDGHWIGYIDADDVVEPFQSLATILQRAEQQGANAIMGRFVDRVTREGRFAPVRDTVELSTQFPMACDITANLVQGYTTKAVLFKPPLGPVEGGYHSLEPSEDIVPLDKELLVYHYKWTQGLHEYMVFRANRGVTSRESKRVIQYLELHDAEFPVKDPMLECRTDLRSDGSAEKITVVMMFDNDNPGNKDNQQEIVGLMSTMQAVQEVVIVWNHPPEVDPPTFSDGIAPVRVVRMPSRSANNRYDPALNISTQTVLFTDDAYDVSMKYLGLLYDKYREVSKQGYVAVGTEPKTLDDSQGYQNNLYNCQRKKHEDLTEDCLKYQMTTPSGVFFLDKKMMDAYFSEKYAAAREYVDTHAGHCDDVLFNFVVSIESGRPPYCYVTPTKKRTMEITQGKAVSRKKLRQEQRREKKLREECWHRFEQLLGVQLSIGTCELAYSYQRSCLLDYICKKEDRWSRY